MKPGDHRPDLCAEGQALVDLMASCQRLPGADAQAQRVTEDVLAHVLECDHCEAVTLDAWAEFEAFRRGRPWR